MSGMAAFMVAVGGTSLICYLLMNRVQNPQGPARERRRWRRLPATSSGGSSGGDGWSLFSLVRQRQFFVGQFQPAIPAGTAEEAVATAAVAVAAIDAENTVNSAREFDLPQDRLFKFIPVFPRHQFGIA